MVPRLHQEADRSENTPIDDQHDGRDPRDDAGAPTPPRPSYDAGREQSRGAGRELESHADPEHRQETRRMGTTRAFQRPADRVQQSGPTSAPVGAYQRIEHAHQEGSTSRPDTSA